MSEQTEPLDVLTAFTVVVDHSGKAWAMVDVVPDGLNPHLRANDAAVKSACINLFEDIRAAEIGNYVAAALRPAPEPSFSTRVAAALARRKEEEDA